MAKIVSKFSSEHCPACRIVEQRMRATGINFTEYSTDSPEFDTLMAYCKSHNLIIRNAPVVTLEVDGKIERIWSGIFDINELQELL